MSDNTTIRAMALWSETQLELLYVALRSNYSGRRIEEIVDDLLGRGMPASYIIEKAQQTCGVIGASRLRRLIQSA